MIVGDGLIANALIDYKNVSDILIFASGVSNSSESTKVNFDREEQLIIAQLHLNIPIIYFSTCSVFDESIKNQPYVLHKLKMEKIITESFENYCIIRLPTVIGITKNPNTFYNSIVTKLKRSEVVNVFENATRYLLDVDDLKWIIPLILKQNKNKYMINVAFDNKTTVTEIVNHLHRKLKSKSEIVFVNQGSDLNIDNTEFKRLCLSINRDTKSTISYNILDKYLYN